MKQRQLPRFIRVPRITRQQLHAWCVISAPPGIQRIAPGERRKITFTPPVVGTKIDSSKSGPILLDFVGEFRNAGGVKFSGNR